MHSTCQKVVENLKFGVSIQPGRELTFSQEFAPKNHPTIGREVRSWDDGSIASILFQQQDQSPS